MKRMMKKRPEGQKRVLVASTNKPLEEKDVESDSDASVKDSDSEDDDATKKTSTKKAATPVKNVKRRVKKVVRKAVATAEE